MWAFECFHEVFKKAPAVLFTDDGSSIAAAFAKMTGPHCYWADTKHLLCVFHIAKNVHKHCRGVFKDSQSWKEFYSLFWKIAKETDKNSHHTWSQDWEQLHELIAQSSQASTKKDDAIEWLESLGERKQQWAARYTWASLTYLIHSTQRAEAINAAIKEKKVKANMNGKALVKGIP